MECEKRKSSYLVSMGSMFNNLVYPKEKRFKSMEELDTEMDGGFQNHAVEQTLVPNQLGPMVAKR